MRQKIKRSLKQYLALLLVLCLVCGTAPVSLAVEDEAGRPDAEEMIASESSETADTDVLQLEVPPAVLADTGDELPVVEQEEKPTATMSGDDFAPQNENSDYAIVLGPEGLTSSYALLDDTPRTVGNYSVNKTYILRFQDESFTVTNSTGGAIRTSEKKLISADGTVLSNGSFTKGGTRDAIYCADTLGIRFMDISCLTRIGYIGLDGESSAFYYVYLIGNTSSDLGYALLIEITPNGAVSQTGAARRTLGEQIARVTGDHAGDWYQSGDRYNGRTTSRNGFWSDLQPVLAAAQSVNDDTSSTAAELSAAIESLSAAIDALIPSCRANATELYEAVQKYGTYKEARYTAETWAPFASALADAQTLLSSLFDAEGGCTEENTATLQPTLDAAVQAMDEAVAGLLDNSTLDSFNYFALLYRRAAEWLLSHTDLHETDYTAASWAAWVQARDTMATCVSAGCGTTENIRAYMNALSDASTAYYALESSADSITVHVRVADTFSLLYPDLALTDDATVTYDDNVTLTGNKTVAGLLSAMAFDGTQKQMASDRIKGYYVYINGVMYVSRANTSVGGWTGVENGAAHLHNGDQVVISVVSLPAYYYYIHNIPNAPYYTYYTYLSQLHIENSDRIIEVEAGQPFEINVRKTNGAAEVETVTTDAVGVDLYLSSIQTDADSARSTPATEKLGIQTDESGKANATIYSEGWYRLAVADVTEQTNGVMSVDDIYVSGGAYENLAVGDYVLLHVVPSSDSQAVRDDLQAELDALYMTYAEEFYTPVQWVQLNSIYVAASESISNSELLGDAFCAQKNGLSQLQSFISTIETEHTQQLRDIEFLVNGIPDNMNDFTEYYLERFLRLRSIFTELSPYMQGQVTLAQQAKADMLESYYDSQNGVLNDGRKYTISLNYNGDGGKFYTRAYIHYNIVFNEPIADRTYFQWNNDASDMDVIPGSQVSITFYDEEVTSLGEGPDIQITEITIAGVDNWMDNGRIDYGYDLIDGVKHFYNNQISFQMPDKDVMISITVGKVGGTGGDNPGDEPVDLETLKNEAILQINDLFSTYDEEKYPDVWNYIVTARDTGLADVAAAASPEEVASAVENASSWMLSVGSDAQYAAEELGISLPYYGDQVGRVFISLENITYPAGNAPFESCYAFAAENVFFAGWYDLCENDTMMTAVLKAFTMNGLSWLGTGGSGYSITYLSTVYVDVDRDGGPDADEPKLAEFSGGPESGWMGTLNDWFVNYGMDQFSYSENELINGDIISIQYTSAGLGSDLGGSFGDPDTSLKALTVDGGTICPAFESTTRTYTLTVPGGTGYIKVTPTAANKNYLVRTFLNNYNSDDAFFSRTQLIPVRSGDVIYVGCGEYTWPSMNNQEGETISYSGTKYMFYVVGGEAERIDKETELLPAVRTLTYSNYLTYCEKIIELYESYDLLPESEKRSMAYEDKIITLHTNVMTFVLVDNIKARIASLPPESEWTEADKISLQVLLNDWYTLNDSVRLSLMTVNEGRIIQTIEAFIMPVTILYGDANGDGRINSRDATRVLRYAAGYQVEIDLKAADANGDGKVNSRDATRILRYAAGYEVTLGK